MNDKNAPKEKKHPEVRGYKFKPWKIALIVLAIGLVVLGFFLAQKEKGSTASDSATTQRDTLGAPPGTETAANVKGFTVETDSQNGGIKIDLGDKPASDGTWSPALLRGGLSFFVAFCLAFAFRQFMRIALIFVGVWAASLFLLQHLGWVEVHWDLIEQQFDNMGSKVTEQLKSAKTFITGSLPSAGMAGLGLFTGFRKG